MRLLARVMFVVISGTFIAGCGARQTPACEIPEHGNLLFEATDRLNPDDDGASLPTIVRVYQLTGLGNLELASFEDIWRDDEETLGDTLVVADEVTVYPGQRLTRTFERDPAANFIVGAAIVRRPAGLSWRSVLDLPSSAEAQRCAALQEDPEDPPPQPAVSRVAFRIDMYTIEGSVLLDHSTGDCAASDLECVRNAAELPDVEEPEAPEVDQPDLPTTPTMPGAKESNSQDTDRVS